MRKFVIGLHRPFYANSLALNNVEIDAPEAADAWNEALDMGITIENIKYVADVTDGSLKWYVCHIAKGTP